MKVFFFLVLVPSFSFASPFGFSAHSFSIYSEGSTVTTTTNFDDFANVVSVSGKQLQENRLELGASYDLSDVWGLHSTVNFKQVATQGLNYNNTVSGPGELTLGSDFILLSDIVKVIPDFSLTIPLGSAPGAYNTAFLTDGSYAITGLAYIVKDFWILKNSFYGGFEWRSLGLSSEIPLGVITKLPMGRHFFLNLKTFGEIALNNDQYSTTPSARNQFIFQYNGGSYKYDAVNPSFFGVKGSLGWNITSSLNVSAGAFQTIYGIRVPYETVLFANLTFRHLPKTSPHFHADDEDQFQVDTEEE